MSRIGKLPIAVPAGVTVTIKDNVVSVKGPKGELSQAVHSDINVEFKDGEIHVTRPSDDRIHRVMKRNDLNAEDALARIRHIDKERANYYRYMSDRKWGFAPNYDLCLNSAAVGIEGSVDMIVSFLEKAGKLPL